MNVKEKLNKIVDYAKESNDINLLIVFGEALISNNSNTIIRIAAEFNEDYDVEESFGNMLVAIDDITEGNFELLIMNGDNLTDETIDEIEEGEIIYVSENSDSQNPT